MQKSQKHMIQTQEKMGLKNCHTEHSKFFFFKHANMQNMQKILKM